MSRTLDIAPLRSLVAVADLGGFTRAATSLHLSQAAVSQHVRRLEAAVGRPLVERHGRGSRFTADGDLLLDRARRLLALHDESLEAFGVEADLALVVGSTEHAAAQLLPDLAAGLEAELADQRVRFRVDRGHQLRTDLAAGRLDLALLLGPSDDPRAEVVGELALTWFAAPTWSRPTSGPLPVVAFDEPCALRARALETLAEHGVAAQIAAEATHLAGVQAVVAAGLGVALMATLGQVPEGLVAREDLPPARPLPLAVWSRRALPADLTTATVDTVRRLLTPPPVLELARGA